MKKLCSFVALTCLLASPAPAEDVPNSVLGLLGLGGMQQMSDQAASQVRGSNTAVTASVSAISGTLVDPDTGNFANFGGLQLALGNADAMFAVSTSSTGLTTDVQLKIGGIIPSFQASVTGTQGGFGTAGTQIHATRIFPYVPFAPAP